MIWWIGYFIVFVISLVIFYKEEINDDTRHGFSWCWCAAILWPFSWFIVLVFYIREWLEEKDFRPIEKFHENLREKYGRK